MRRADKRRAAQANAAFVCTCSRLISLALITVGGGGGGGGAAYEIHGADLARPANDKSSQSPKQNKKHCLRAA